MNEQISGQGTRQGWGRQSIRRGKKQEQQVKVDQREGQERWGERGGNRRRRGTKEEGVREENQERDCHKKRQGVARRRIGGNILVQARSGAPEPLPVFAATSKCRKMQIKIIIAG